MENLRLSAKFDESKPNHDNYHSEVVMRTTISSFSSKADQSDIDLNIFKKEDIEDSFSIEDTCIHLRILKG